MQICNNMNCKTYFKSNKLHNAQYNTIHILNKNVRIFKIQFHQIMCINLNNLMILLISVFDDIKVKELKL